MNQSIEHIEKASHDIKTPAQISAGLKKDRFKNDFGYYEDTSKHTIDYIKYLSRIVETALLCIPFPPIGAIEECDGCLSFTANSQIPGALVAFMENKFPLVGMKVLTDAEGCFYNDLMGIYRNRIDDCRLDVHYILRTINDGLKQDLFFNSLRGNFSCD